MKLDTVVTSWTKWSKDLNIIVSNAGSSYCDEAVS